MCRNAFGYTIQIMKKTTPVRRHTSMLNVRVLPEHAELIRQAAELAGVSISDWIRERLLRQARRELAQG